MSRARTANDTEYSQLGGVQVVKWPVTNWNASAVGVARLGPAPGPGRALSPLRAPHPAARQQQPCTLLALA